MITVQLTSKQFLEFSQDVVRKYPKTSPRARINRIVMGIVVAGIGALLLFLKQFLFILILLLLYVSYRVHDNAPPSQYSLMKYSVTLYHDLYCVEIDEDQYQLAYADLRLVRKLEQSFYLYHKLHFSIHIPFDCIHTEEERQKLEAVFVTYNDHYRK
jgi:hypothetical protein